MFVRLSYLFSTRGYLRPMVVTLLIGFLAGCQQAGLQGTPSGGKRPSVRPQIAKMVMAQTLARAAAKTPHLRYGRGSVSSSCPVHSEIQ